MPEDSQSGALALTITGCVTALMGLTVPSAPLSLRLACSGSGAKTNCCSSGWKVISLTSVRADAGSTATPCRLHLYHHGCGGPWGSTFYEGVSHRAGFNEWAEANDLVVLYPAMRNWGHTVETKAGCWDGSLSTGPCMLRRSLVGLF